MFKIGDKVVYNFVYYYKNKTPLYKYFIVSDIRVDGEELFEVNGYSVEGVRHCTEEEKEKYFNF